MDFPAGEHDRAAAAAALLARSRAHLLRVARRVSLCADDAEDAVGRTAEIVLTRAPAIEGGRLLAWATVVVRREALALRRSRERLLGFGAPRGPEGDPLEIAVSPVPSPAEAAERAEWVSEAWAALAALKPAQQAALVLQAQGYSYAEIGKLRGWTYTKVNRCLAEGRAALRAREASPRVGTGSNRSGDR